jgi:23S rRNA (uridine2552-2'-O)-methyltransferase
VGIQRGIHLFDDGGAEAVVANVYHGIEVVGIGSVGFALNGCKFYLRHGTIIGYRGLSLACVQQGVGMKVKTQSKKVNKAWLNQQVNDPYVKAAKRDGFRARAAYKLKEIDETYKLIQPGDFVVDLGSTPGAWSQYLRRRLSPQGAATGALNGHIVALDLLDMEPIDSVHFIQGDFREDSVLAQLKQKLDDVQPGRLVDVVVSDMAPNLSGIASSDTARITHLIELAVDFACAHLKPDGSLVVKLFHGGGYSQLVELFRTHFLLVKPIKPKSSRSDSSETFLLGRGLKGVSN